MSGNRRSSFSISTETKIKNRRSSQMRRSFGGKNSGVEVSRGFNTANSTSVFPRSSVDRTGKSMEREFEEKENGVDRFSKQSTVVSPGLSKPMKHFMSPTISAVSKINASPRKKILAEKNDFSRSSWGSFNACEEGGGARSEVEASESHEKTVTDSSSVKSRNSSMKKVVFDSEVRVIPLIEEEAENKAEKSTYIKSPRSPLAPLDADPSMTPYDPDTNYLLPRPQFLHYHPTSRIERFLEEETDGHYLNDSIDFVEGLFETELTEETSSIDSSREPQNKVSVDKELKDDAEVVFTMGDEKIDVGGSIVIEKEEVDARDVVSDEVSELNLDAGDDSMATTDEMEATEEMPVVETGKENGTEAKHATKGLRFFTKFKLFALIFAVLVAGMVMSGVYSPITSSGKGISKDWRLYEIVQEAEIVEYVKMNVDVVAQNFGWLYDDSSDHIFGLIRKLRGESEPRGMNYHNLSAMQDDSVFRKDSDIHLLLDNQNQERSVVESGLLPGPEAESLDDKDETGTEEDNDSFEDAGRGGNTRFVDADIAGKTLMPLRDEETKQEESDLEFLEKFEIDMRNESIEDTLDADITGKTLTPFQDEATNQEESDLDAIESIEESSEIPENTDERTEIESGDEWGEDDEPATAESLVGHVHPAAEFPVESLEAESDDLETNYARDDPSTFIAVGGIFALALTLVTFAGLMYFKSKRAAMAAPSSTKFDIIPSSATNMEEKKHASSICPTVVDVTGESCRSEMSSYQKNSFRIHKRESLASSSGFSTGSPSYGSFTTYDKFPLKHRNGEEEVVITPIRRSSRLLKQVTSP